MTWAAFIALALWALQALAFLRTADVVVNGRRMPGPVVVLFAFAWPALALHCVLVGRGRS
jgi:hypothetical protein